MVQPPSMVGAAEFQQKGASEDGPLVQWSSMSEIRGPRVRLVAFAAGGVLSIAADRLLAKQSPSRRVTAYAAGLVSAAGVYPIARLGRPADSAVLTREWTAVLATTAVLVGAIILPKEWAARLTAGGWLAHAVFDHAHERGGSSRLPGWYPALCAGYDVGVAALLSPNLSL